MHLSQLIVFQYKKEKTKMIKLHNKKGKRSPLFYAVWASPGIGVAANAQTYYFKYVIGDISAMTIVALVSIVGPFSIAAFPALSKKMGMRNLMAAALILGAVGRALPFFQPTNMVFLIIGSLFNAVSYMPLQHLHSANSTLRNIYQKSRRN